MSGTRAHGRLIVRFGLPVIGLAASAIYAGLPNDSSACMCVCSAPPEEALAENDLVFFGRVNDIRNVFGCGTRVVLEFEVLEGFRGAETGDIVEVSAKGTGGGDCGLAQAFEVGDEVLLFTDAKDPWVSLCSLYVRAPDGHYDACPTKTDDGDWSFDEVIAALEAATD